MLKKNILNLSLILFIIGGLFTGCNNSTNGGETANGSTATLTIEAPGQTLSDIRVAKLGPVVGSKELTDPATTENQKTYTFDVDGLTEVMANYNRNTVRFFVKPNSKSTIVFEEGNLKLADEAYNSFITKRNEVMSAAMQEAGQDLWTQEPEAFKNFVESTMEKVDAELSSVASKLDKEIYEAESAMTQIQKVNFYSNYPSYYNRFTQQEAPARFEEEISAILANKDVAKPYLSSYVNMVKGKAQSELEKKWDAESKEIVTLPQYIDFMVSAIDNVEGEDMKSIVFASTLKDISSFSIAQAKKVFDEKKSTLKEADLKKVDAIFEEWATILPGQPAPDFTTVDTDGNEVKLSDFKGKYVYIDVWATWCGPCLKEIPKLKALEEKYHDNDIVFMSVSIDDTPEPWLKMVEDKDLQGVQVYIEGAWNSAITKQYKINGIPRFILVDPDGNIVDPQAERPSGAIEDTFKEVL